MFIFKLIIFFTTILNIGAFWTPFFRFDYVYIGDFSAHYKHYSQDLTHTIASSTCLNEGAQLWAPKNRNELEKIYNTFIKAADIFLGYYRFGNNSKFISIDGFELDKTNLNGNLNYPNHCVSGSGYSITNYFSCNETKLEFICKKSINELFPNKWCENFDPAYFFVSSLQSCYKFHTTHSPWRVAENTCRAENATLVIINSDSEAEMLIDQMKSRPVNHLQANFHNDFIYVGFTNHLIKDFYLTIKGKTLIEAGYSKWANKEPSVRDIECGAMNRNGTLSSMNCEYEAMFVCEKEISKESNGTTEHPPTTSDPEYTTKDNWITTPHTDQTTKDNWITTPHSDQTTKDKWITTPYPDQTTKYK